MKIKNKAILTELKSHIPFTLIGALTGLVVMFLFKNVEEHISHRIFYILHPTHVVLSALVTGAMYYLHKSRTKLAFVIVIGIVGSIGITTLSDSLIPYLGEYLLGMHINVHEHTGFAERVHIGFIEGWQIVLPAALLGAALAWFKPKTKFPHAGHVLLSTWASSFHMVMAMGGEASTWQMLGSLVFLFLAVWLPCCISDIVFPLLLIGEPSVEPLEKGSKTAFDKNQENE